MDTEEEEEFIDDEGNLTEVTSDVDIELSSVL